MSPGPAVRTIAARVITRVQRDNLMHAEPDAGFFRRRLVRRIAWMLVIAVLLSGIGGGLYRGLKVPPDPDWRSFYHESVYVWERGEIAPGTAMFGYLPATFFALWPFSLSPQPAGLVAFVLLNAVAAVASWILLLRHWFDRGDMPDVGAFVWPVLLTVGHFQHVQQANQFTIWVLLLCVAGLTLLMRRREWAGGFVIGLAACIKVTPFVFLPYLLIRRQWRAVAGLLLAIVLLDVVPSVVFFGPRGAIDEHSKWLRRAEWYSARRMIEDPLLRVRRHGNNCSYAVVLGRWLRSTENAEYQVILSGDPPPDVIAETSAALQPNEYLVLDPMPTAGTVWAHRRDKIPDVPRYHVADLSANAVWYVWACTLAAAVGALMLFTMRYRMTPPGGSGWTAEVSLWLLMMFWLTPMMRDYYLALALPAYVVVWRAALVQTSAGRRSFGPAFAAAALAFFAATVPCLGWNDANWYGFHLAATAALAAATAWAWRTERRRHIAVRPTPRSSVYPPQQAEADRRRSVNR
ncbi:MAG: glycosyltransferase family 87 protein [Planctomycetota bacterium]